MTLEALYTKVDVYRKPSYNDNIGNLETEGEYSYYGTIQGYIQPRSGSYSNVNQSNIPLFNSVLYTSVSAASSSAATAAPFSAGAASRSL